MNPLQNCYEFCIHLLWLLWTRINIRQATRPNLDKPEPTELAGELITVLLLCYQFRYSSCDTTASCCCCCCCCCCCHSQGSRESILEQRRSKRRHELACLLYSVGEVFHARVNLNVASKVSPGKALTARRHPRYPAAQRGLKRERSWSSL